MKKRKFTNKYIGKKQDKWLSLNNDTKIIIYFNK